MTPTYRKSPLLLSVVPVTGYVLIEAERTPIRTAWLIGAIHAPDSVPAARPLALPTTRPRATVKPTGLPASSAPASTVALDFSSTSTTSRTPATVQVTGR